jgi:hypothetical protein
LNKKIKIKVAFILKFKKKIRDFFELDMNQISSSLFEKKETNVVTHISWHGSKMRDGGERTEKRAYVTYKIISLKLIENTNTACKQIRRV